MSSDKPIEAVMPLYRKIYLDIKQQINNNSLKSGDKLPSEQFLCEQYQVSRITVRKALKLLTDERLIVTVQGKGSYVNLKKMTGNWIRFRVFQNLPFPVTKLVNHKF